MCGIAGYSLSKNSRINPRKLAKALLIEMDVRGNQASGYAWQSSTGAGIYKRDASGTAISMKQMSKGTRVAVLHTRYATHGSITNNANNHPVLSPDKTISLVHNGVIYNHNTVRTHIDSNLPEVDSSVIPALLQQFERNTDKFDMLDGDASVAWLDDNDKLTLKVARISHSPLTIAQLPDGSFIFASTESILLNALERMHLDAIYLEGVAERSLLTIVNGSLNDVEVLPELDPQYEERFTYGYNTNKYRNMTSGGHSTPKTAPSEASLFIPSDWYGEDLDEYYSKETDPNEVGDYLADPEYYGFPELEDYLVNEYGEYFTTEGEYMGSVDDMVEMGYMTTKKLDQFTNAWCKKNFIIP